MTTINDVAKHAGVSVVTASRVLNNVDTVRPALRAKVEKAIEELGYVPNAVARSLRSKQTRSLAVIVPVIASPHWHGIIQAIEDVAKQRNYVVLLCSTREDDTIQQHYLDMVISQHVDGVIIAPCDSNPEKLEPLRERGIPTIVINRRVEGWEGDMVYSDCVSGAYALVSHLIGAGHQRVGIVSGLRHIPPLQDRIAGYCLALNEANIPYDERLIRFTEDQNHNAEVVVDELLALDQPPTAIFATTNSIAKHIMDALLRRKLRIPEDMALVCFGEFPEAYFPFFTLILEPAYRLGVLAADMLFDQLGNGDEWQPRHEILPTQLVVRASCGSQQGIQPQIMFPDPSTIKTDVRPVLRLPADQRSHLSELMQALSLPVTTPI